MPFGSDTLFMGSQFGGQEENVSDKEISRPTRDFNERSLNLSVLHLTFCTLSLSTLFDFSGVQLENTLKCYVTCQ